MAHFKMIYDDLDLLFHSYVEEPEGFYAWAAWTSCHVPKWRLEIGWIDMAMGQDPGSLVNTQIAANGTFLPPTYRK